MSQTAAPPQHNILHPQRASVCQRLSPEAAAAAASCRLRSIIYYMAGCRMATNYFVYVNLPQNVDVRIYSSSVYNLCISNMRNVLCKVQNVECWVSQIGGIRCTLVILLDVGIHLTFTYSRGKPESLSSVGHLHEKKLQEYVLLQSRLAPGVFISAFCMEKVFTKYLENFRTAYSRFYLIFFSFSSHFIPTTLSPVISDKWLVDSILFDYRHSW